jgi:asparagine synthase (glutamine-hydrolysing)
MCGIAGLIPSKFISQQNLLNIGQRLSQALEHRGPDSQAQWFADNGDLLLAHTRLSIQDLSPAGNQPMTSTSGRYVIVFNGEIYNFQKLKKHLKQSPKGNSDTEVLLLLLEEKGLDATLKQIEGMFAFAVYDQKEKRIHFARDPIGKKPLYLGWNEEGFYFASELKAIQKASNANMPELDKEVIQLYLRWRYVPDPYCIYKNFWKLPPGHSFSVSIEELKNPFDITKTFKQFWDFNKIFLQAPKPIEEKGIIQNLEEILLQAVSNRMIADVPVGAFLSGGIDSSLIVSLMSKLSSGQVKTYTVNFDDPEFNEGEIAKKTANALGTEHLEFLLKPSDSLDTAKYITNIFDEPFGDPSAIPTYHVCRLAKENVKVVLTGDGGDESFGGYNWYNVAESFEKYYLLPHAIRPALPNLIGLLYKNPKVQKFLTALTLENKKDIYPYLLSSLDALYKNAKKEYLPTSYDQLREMNWNKSFVEYLMACDSKMFLPGDVLTKVDRCSMHHSLEVRSPLLDKNVISYAWSLPLKMKRRGGQSKWALQELLKRHLPDYNFNNTKRGFSIPHSKWLKNELREWGESLFNDKALSHGYINPDMVEPYWSLHKEGKKDYGHYLWTLAMLQSWLVNQKV